MSSQRWIRPEAYPLFAAVGTAVGLCAFMLTRAITSHPDVRVKKEDRAAGYIENYDEGRRYKDHAVRHFLRDKTPEIFRTVNKHFSEPE